MTISRRNLLRTSAGVAAAAAGAKLFGKAPAFAQSAPKSEQEKGASLRLLRWAPFVKGDEDAWLANTKKFTEATGVAVRGDRGGWPDLPPKSAGAATVGAGPDIIIGFSADPQIYANKLVSMNDLADYLGKKYGGWEPLALSLYKNSEPTEPN